MQGLVGQSISHFRILEKLGEGGMGVVYKAIDETLRRTVALKVLPPSLAEHPQRRARLLREARAAAAVNHPNIATVHEVGESGGRVFIAMEYVEGRSLRAMLGDGPVPVPRALHLATQVARALASAHQAGVVHRDLKPDNVIVASDDHVKLLDFGLARLWDDEPPASPDAAEHMPTATQLTEAGQLLGTPAYMSPEQARGKAVDRRTDVFAFGVLLFEMVTGQRPFQGESTTDVLAAIARDTPKAPSQLDARVPASVDRIVARCLEKSVDARYDGGQAVVDALTGSVAAPQPRARARWLLAMTASLVAIGTAGLFAARTRGAAPAAASGASASLAPAPGPTTILDLPPPTTSTPEAAREYALGMKALHDNSWGSADKHFARAAELNPSMGAAHLRRAMTSISQDAPERRRAEFRRAVELRDDLPPRDQSLLDALEPILLRQTQDNAEAVRRVRAMSAKAPLDVELHTWLGLLRPDGPERLESADRAIALDADDAQSWTSKGSALFVVGRTDEARAALEHCTQVSRNSAQCFLTLAGVERIEGRCDAYVDAAQKWSDHGGSVTTQVFAMANAGSPIEAVRELATKEISTRPPEDQPLYRAEWNTWLAMLEGDFVGASKSVAEEGAALDASPTRRTELRPRRLVAWQRAEIALETGDDAGARAVARDFVAKSEAWTGDEIFSKGLNRYWTLARLAQPAGDAVGADFEARRHVWIDRQIAAGVFRGQSWVHAYAAPAQSRADAEAALATLVELGPPSSMPGYGWGGTLPDADTGTIYLLAGRAREAIPWLRRAAASCTLLDATWDRVRAELALGEALEATDDKAGACEAYGRVVARWGHAKPRSVSADEARRRSRALGCGG